MSSSCPSGIERDRMLKNIAKIWDLDEELKRKHVEIEEGDYESEIAHSMTVEWLNSELKKRGY